MNTTIFGNKEGEKEVEVVECRIGQSVNDAAKTKGWRPLCRQELKSVALADVVGAVHEAGRYHFCTAAC